MTTNDKGYVTLADDIDKDFSAAAIVKPTNGIIKIGSAYLGIADNCAVYNYNATSGVITETTLSGIADSSSATGVYTVNDNGAITAIYFAK